MSVLTLQSNLTILLDAEHRDAEAARFSIAPLAELHKTPGPLHHYRLTPLSLWNAAAAGWSAADALDALEMYADHPAPTPMRAAIARHIGAYGQLWIEDDGSEALLCANDTNVLAALEQHPPIRALLHSRRDPLRWRFDPAQRGELKHALLASGHPADDRSAPRRGAPLAFSLRPERLILRDYQREAIARVTRHGSGVVVLPCGAGKTLVGIGLMAAQQSDTLILTPNITAARQWAAELADKTTLAPDAVGEYSGERKQVRPVTLATYQMLIQRGTLRLPHRPAQTAEQSPRETGSPGAESRPHLALFSARDWGLIIYDEVHLLPAPVFRLAAGLQSTLRLGLTATLVREDNLASDVFALIGPTRYQAGWKQLERDGWIAEAVCTEVRVPLDDEARRVYIRAPAAERARIAAENGRKTAAVRRILAKHPDEQVLIIGQYLSQLSTLAQALGAPLITGKTPNAERELFYALFRNGSVRWLVVSKVANSAVDLPDASVAVQVSGAFGSRQEEAQRLGRLLRPKAGGRQAHFYTLVSADTSEQTHAARRQRFLIEQGYTYRIVPMV